MNIQRTSDWAGSVNMLIYAPAGHGKTQLCGSAQDDPRTSPTLILAFEKGIRTLSDRSDIDVGYIEEPEDFDAVYALLTSEQHEYNSVCIDSLTEAYQMYLLYEIRRQFQIGRRKDDMTAEIQDYGRVAIQMRRLIRFFRDLPMTTVFTALAQTLQDDTTKMISTKPLLGGQKLPDELPALLNAIFYLGLTETQEGEVQRVLLTCPQPRLVARVHQPPSIPLPEEIEDPTMTSILDAMGVPLPSGAASKKGGAKKKKARRR